MARPVARSVWVFCCVLVCPPRSASADPPQDDPASHAGSSRRLSEVLVTASRAPGSPLNADEFPGNATVITSEMLAASGAASLPEYLGRFEGVTSLDTHGFGLGSDGSVNLRGVINSSRTGALVLVDGVRMNRPTGDEVHWQSIPLHQIERIEIIRGGGGIGYGEGALSGVINIITKKGGERPLETEQRLEWGSFGQRMFATAARGAQGPLTYGATFTRRDVSGYRESTNSRTTTVTSHLGLDVLPELRVEANVLHSEDTSSFAGGITPEASQARRRQRGSFPGFFDDETTQVSLDTRLADVAGIALGANAFWRLRESDSVTSDSRFAIITPSQGLTLRASHEAERPGVRHQFTTSIDLLDEKSSVGTRGSPRFDESNRASYGLWAEETLRLLDRVTATAGLRYDKARFAEDISFPVFIGTLRFQGLSPMVGLSVDVAEPLTVYGRYARPFKAPNVDDFSAVVTDFVGNINLQPQQADDYEVGLRASEARLGKAAVAWFYNRIDDEILFNASAFQNQNMDTERLGVETSLEPRLPIPGLSARLAYTFLDAKFRKGPFRGKTIPSVPEHRLTTSLSYEPVPRLFLALDWELIQDFFRINDFNNRLPGDNYGVLDLGVRLAYDWGSVYLKIQNATNEEYTSFQSSNGTVISTGENPSPPRSFLIGLTVQF